MEVKSMETNSTIIKDVILEEKDYDKFFNFYLGNGGDVRIVEKVIEKLKSGSRKDFSVERTLEEPYPEISNDILKYNVVRYIFSDDVITYFKNSNKDLEYRLINSCLNEDSEECDKFILKYLNCNRWRMLGSGQQNGNVREFINNLQCLKNFTHRGEKILSLFFSENLDLVGLHQKIFAIEIVKIVGIESFIGFLAKKNQELGEDLFQRRYGQAYTLLKPIEPTDL